MYLFYYVDLHHAFGAVMGVFALLGGARCAWVAMRDERKQELRCLVPQDRFFTVADLGYLNIKPDLLPVLVRELCAEGLLVWKPRYMPPRSWPASAMTSVPCQVPTEDDFAGVGRVTLGDVPPAVTDLHRYKFRVAYQIALAA